MTHQRGLVVLDVDGCKCQFFVKNTRAGSLHGSGHANRTRTELNRGSFPVRFSWNRPTIIIYVRVGCGSVT